MSRFVIQYPNGMFYTDNAVVATVYVPRKGNPLVNDPVLKLSPKFESHTAMFALKYETAEDAQSVFTHPDLADPVAFDGCKVLETEFDSKQPAATR